MDVIYYIYINAQQLKSVHLSANTKKKLLRHNDAFWFNKMCRLSHLIPKYIYIYIYIYITINTSIVTLSGFTSIIWQFVVLYQYSREGTMMVVVIATEICR
jgi:hypothetical protein